MCKNKKNIQLELQQESIDPNQNTQQFSRREFIQSGALIASSLMMLPIAEHPLRSFSKLIDTTSIWYKQPLRILQTVLREIDAKNYDAASVVQYMKNAHCNLLVVNAGGIVDFFQNPLPMANINPFMGKRDILKEITEACHSSGIRVIARIDFRGVEEHVYKTNPEWFSIDSKGLPMQLNYTKPALYSACYTGHYRNEHAEEFIKYLLGNYRLDGIWHNSIGVGDICYCNRCKDSYFEFSGGQIPILGKSPEVEFDSYMTWKTWVADKHMDHMKRTVKGFGEDKVYTAEVFSMFESGGRIHSGIDLYNARDHFDFLVSVAFLTENSDLIHYEDLNYSSTIIKFLKSMAPEKEAIVLYGGNGTAHRYVMDPPLDLQV